MDGQEKKLVDVLALLDEQQKALALGYAMGIAYTAGVLAPEAAAARQTAKTGQDSHGVA